MQEAKDNYPRPKSTRMGQDVEFYYVYWGQTMYRKSIPYEPSTNVLILYTATLLRAYHAFATTIEAMEGPFFRWERVLQFSGRGHTVDKPKLVPEEFVAEENVNYWKDISKGGSQCRQQDGEDDKLSISSLAGGTIKGHPTRTTHL